MFNTAIGCVLKQSHHKAAVNVKHDRKLSVLAIRVERTVQRTATL